MAMGGGSLGELMQAERAVNGPRPFQFTLWQLLLATTVVAVLLAAASGAFGQVIQFLMFGLFVALFAFVFEVLGGLLLLGIVIVTVGLPWWLAARAIRFFVGMLPWSVPQGRSDDGRRSTAVD
jgi:hypothetical protein